MPFSFLRMGQAFGQRLRASLGPREAFRAENWLCVARLLLALFCFAWTRPDFSAMSQDTWQLHDLFRLYILFSFAFLMFLWLYRRADLTFRLIVLIADLLFVAIITHLTGGPASPYALLWLFVVSSAAYRWGMRETMLTAAIGVALSLADVALLRLAPEWLPGPRMMHFDPERLLLRADFLLGSGLLIGYLLELEKQLHAEDALLARLLGWLQLKSSMDEVLGAVFAEIAPLYFPLKASVALRKEGQEEAFVWDAEHPLRNPTHGKVRSVLHFSKLEQIALVLPAHTWHYVEIRGRLTGAPRLVALNAGGKSLRKARKSKEVVSLVAMDAPSLLVSAFTLGDGWSGHLILFSPYLRGDQFQALHFLQRVLRKISPALQNAHLRGVASSRVGDQVRAELTRELHDGTIQSLLSAEMQLEVVRRQTQNSSTDVQQRLAAVQSLLHQEVLNLRDLIEEIKPLDFSPKELPGFLAEIIEKFRRETGISARLVTQEEKLPLSAGVCHEVVRIVQEGLSNIRKHSGAKNVVITLGEENRQCKLWIADDGQGFGFRGRATQSQLDAAHRGPGVIKERVRLIGGELTIDSSPGRGARLEITIPEVSHHD